jgi:predicted transcriptional regulator
MSSEEQRPQMTDFERSIRQIVRDELNKMLFPPSKLKDTRVEYFKGISREVKALLKDAPGSMSVKEIANILHLTRPSLKRSGLAKKVTNAVHVLHKSGFILRTGENGRRYRYYTHDKTPA